MLHEFLTSNRNELIKRCRDAVAERFEPSEIPAVVDHGVPLFLQQLAGILRVEQLTPARDREEKKDDGSETTKDPAQPTEIGRTAALHGAELLRLGFSIDQVVHGYGDVCQAVTGLAVEQDKSITTDEFRTLNRCLDNAIADAVTAFAHARQTSFDDHAEDLDQRLNTLSDEQRRLVDIAIHAYSAIKTGNIGLTGATGALLIHALTELRSLPDRVLPDIRQANANGQDVIV